MSEPEEQETKEQEKEHEPQKSYETILEQEIRTGKTELERPARGSCSPASRPGWT